MIFGFLEPITNFFAGGIEILLQKSVSRNNKTGDTEAALGRTVFDERLLNGVQVFGCADAFYRCDFGVVGNSADFGHAGTNNFAVHNNVTETSLV